MIHNLFSFFRNVFDKSQRSQKPDKNVQKISSRIFTSYSEEKQNQIQDLCAKLFEQQELITSGRLQLIGLDKVKRRLGKMWDGLRPIVYQTVEDAAEKFLDPQDLLIRYKDDTFLVVFAQDKGPIAEAKIMLIVDEIRKVLFEHEEEELRNIDVQSVVTDIKPLHFKDKNYTPEALNEAVDIASIKRKGHIQKKSGVASTAEPKDKKKVELPKAVEVQTSYSQNTPEQKKSKAILKSAYMPLWDVEKNALTTYIYQPSFAKNKDASKMSKDDVAKLDIATLNEVKRQLDNKRLFLVCPVHFDTLSYGPNNEKYRIACQDMDKEQKQLLSFLIVDVPSDIDLRKDDFKSKITPFKNFSSSFWAEWGLRAKKEHFDILREIGFSVVAHKLNPHQDEAWNINNMSAFVSMAQTSQIDHTAALGISSLSLTTSAVCNGFDYIGGSAIHDHVDAPDNIYRFENEDLFS